MTTRVGGGPPLPPSFNCCLFLGRRGEGEGDEMSTATAGGGRGRRSIKAIGTRSKIGDLWGLGEGQATLPSRETMVSKSSSPSNYRVGSMKIPEFGRRSEVT